jgi:hypothetical protein
MRHSPTVEFILDALPESAAHIEELLERARREDAEVAAAAATASYAGDADPYKRPDDDTAEDASTAPRAAMGAPDGLLIVDNRPASRHTTWWRAAVVSPRHARWDMPAPWTRWRPVCSWWASVVPPA